MVDPGRGGERRPKRVLLGLSEIAGYYGNLRVGLHDAGVAVTFVDLTDHPFRYHAGSSNLLVRLTRRASAARRGVLRSARFRWFGRLAVEVALRLVLFGWAVLRFDVFVFGFGSTFLGVPGAELRLLRLLRKTVICVYHGSDSRPPYQDGALMAADRGRTAADCVRLTKRAKARIAAADRWATHVVDNPPASHFHERPCVHWLRIGIPYVPPAVDPDAAPLARGDDAPVRILHSPSHPEAKGSRRIGEAIDKLRERGYAIDFVQITGRPHAEVARELARCDFVVDQLYSDTPMAGFAAEAANFGKATVVAGYAAEAFAGAVPPALMPPTEYCHPDDIEAAIERLAVDADYRRALGCRAREFVRTQWSPRRVAERYLRLIRGDVPEEWTFAPDLVGYVHGFGLPEARARALIAEVVAIGGRAALHVTDKPLLEQRLLDFARTGTRGSPPACSASS